MERCSAIMKNGDACMNIANKETGRCNTHKHKRAVTGRATPAYTMVLARANGNIHPNQTFSQLAQSTQAEFPYFQRIEHLRLNGPAHGGEEDVHGVQCRHDTQGRNNCTVWYNWSGNAIIIWGLGRHRGGDGSGNRRYSMTWFDGTSKNWTRR